MVNPKDLLDKDLGSYDKAKTKAESESNEEEKKKFTTSKYSSNGTGPLFESIILGGKPYFITYNRNAKKIQPVDCLETTFGTLNPPKHNEMSYMPYEFETLVHAQALADNITKNHCSLAKSRNIRPR